VGGEKTAFDTWSFEFREHLVDFDPNNVFVALLAFMDDCYIVARNYAEAQIMMNELVKEFEKWGLSVASEKLKFMSENCDCDLAGVQACLWHGDVAVERVQVLKVLGGKIASRGDERIAYEHRIASAWACYWKWQHVLESGASIKAKISFWHATVGRSMMYNLCTTRADVFNSERLAITQRNMVRRMLRLKRQPITLEPLVREQWVDWQIRSLRRAGEVVKEHASSVVTVLELERAKWASHVRRFGVQGKPQHILKCILLWRNVSWWKWQQFYNEAGAPFR
jgi:hypothetical protein